MDLHIAAGAAGARTHPNQAESARVGRRGSETAAVIGDTQRDLVARALQLDPHMLGGSVAGHIGERLLGDAEEMRLDLILQASGKRSLAGDFDAGALSESFAQPA